MLLTLILGAFALLVLFCAADVAWLRVKESFYPYNHYTNSYDVVKGLNLTGKVIVITGANAGLGRETAKRLFSVGAVVVMACRNLDKANKARKEIAEEVKDQSINNLIVMKLDLGNLKSIDPFVEEFSQNEVVNKRLDVLLCNAGVMGFPTFGTTSDGMERQWGINHLGHFYLVNKLLPILRANKSRIVCLSSRGHKFSNYRMMRTWLDDQTEFKGPTPKTVPYDAWYYYGISKLSNILFARHLNTMYNKDGILALALHPGDILTDLGNSVSFDYSTLVTTIGSYSDVLNMKTLHQGAATSLRAVTIPDNELEMLPGGRLSIFFYDCRQQNNQLWWEFRDWKNTDIDEKLWAHSVSAIQSLDYLSLNE